MSSPAVARLELRARQIAGDHDAGASELLERLLALLGDASAEGAEATLAVARIVCRGQPAMAPLWNASAAAYADFEEPGLFARTRAEMLRAPRALVKAASAALRDALQTRPAAGGDGGRPLLLTLSYSRSVRDTLLSLATSQSLAVVCGEGRPRYEGRRLATELAAGGIAVTVVVDAALTSFLDRAAAAVVGADALLGDRWINKVGTRGLAAAASLAGVPAFVVASRDKAVATALMPHLRLPTADPAEVWPAPGQVIDVINGYFELTSVQLATLFLTDRGPVAPDDLPSLVRHYDRPISTLLSRF